MNPEGSSLLAPAPVARDALTLAVRNFIARVGPEAALERFLERPPTGPKRLELHRVEQVAAGEAEPTLAMCEVAFDDWRARLGSVPAAGGTTPPASVPPAEAFVPVTVQPWEQPVRPTRARQPWENRGGERVQQ